MPKTLLDDDERVSVWVELENRATFPVLTRKYKNVDFFSEQRVFHPEERGLITHGAAWSDSFRVKVFSLDESMKKKFLLKLTVDKLYRVTVSDDGCSVRVLQSDSIDKQLCAYERMEEVWDNSNYYETLRLPQDATARDIRLAYLKLAKIYHPDHNKHPQAPLMFERITEAYHTLSDEEIRKRYDTHLRTDPGVMSKSYWRQIFLHWNRHKAIQVGISTLLCITGSVILLTSILAAPTGAALPASIIGGAIGGGIFASGIGGISIALSRQAALEDNRVYKTWLKYSFWYGIAGAVTGAVSAGVGGLLGTAVGGGMAAVVASGAVNGGVQGLCFGVGGGIASDRWLDLIKRLRIDSIVMDLLVSTLTGAATGLLFQSMIMTTAGAPSAVMGHAKFSAEQLAGNSGGSLVAKKTEHPRKVLKRIRTNSAPLQLTYRGEDKPKEQQETPEISPQKKENPEYEENEDCTSLSAPNLRNPALIQCKIEITQTEDIANTECKQGEEEKISNESLEGNPSTQIDSKVIDKHITDTPKSDTSGTKTEATNFFVPPEIEEFLQCEENTVACINEAMVLYDTVKDTWPGQFLQFYNHARAKKVRMLVDFTVPDTDGTCAGDTEDLRIVRNIVLPQEMFFVPDTARFIQIHFEHSSVGILWDPICSYQDWSHTFAYSIPTTRRFFVVGFGDAVHISQIRDEYEQLVIE